MSEVFPGPGWWQASDGKWYPPEAYQVSPSSAQPGTDAIRQTNLTRSNRRHGQGLRSLTTSRQVLVLAAIAGGLVAIGEGLATIGWIVLQSTSSSTTKNLITAGAWVSFAGFFVALVAVLYRVWNVLSTNQLGELWELGAAGLAALFMGIGSLLGATEVSSTIGSLFGVTEVSSTPDAGSHIIFAIGVAVWGIIAIAIAAANNVSEHQSLVSAHAEVVTRRSPYWLGAGGAVILLAVALGFPTPSFPDGTPGVVSGSLAAVGFMVFLGVLAVARSRQLIRSSVLQILLAALGTVVLEQIARAVAYSLIFSSSAGITTVRVSEALTTGLGVLAYLLLAAVAWRRLDEVSLGLYNPAGSSQTSGGYREAGFSPSSTSPPPMSTGSLAPSAVREGERSPASGAPWSPTPEQPPLVHCGRVLPPGATFCAICGTRLAPPANG
jgi:hypothetical protein